MSCGPSREVEGLRATSTSTCLVTASFKASALTPRGPGAGLPLAEAFRSDRVQSALGSAPSAPGSLRRVGIAPECLSQVTERDTLFADQLRASQRKRG